MRRNKTLPTLQSLSTMLDVDNPPKGGERSKKFRWLDNQGRMLTAGGLLPYDEDGIWAIGEINKDDVLFTDMGGKYQFEDGSIYQTIAREAYEETYGMLELTRSVVESYYSKYPVVYVNGHKNKPVYSCVVVPIGVLNVDLNNDIFTAKRLAVIKSNPDVPPGYYNSVCIRHLSFAEINSAKHQLSYRLRRVLKYGPFSSKVDITVLSTPSSSPTPPEVC